MSNEDGPDLYTPLTEREEEIVARLAAGLSDQQIAAALFLSFNTVRWYNRQIYSKLGVASRTQAVARAKALGLVEKVAAPLPRTIMSTSLPHPATPFVGREGETVRLMELLQHTRLLTLTGVGGTGKTRLALHVARVMAPAFADGVCFVDLAPVKEATLVAHAIATALNIVEQPHESLPDSLPALLAKREMLLLIDNFEHLITAAPLLAELLSATSSLKMIVTSREVLRLSGEQEFQVPPLSLPSAEKASVDDIRASEAGSLFLQRAKSTNPHFDLNRDNAPAIAQICRRLDGLPLAIELAAVRCKLLPPQLLIERLNRPLAMLTGGVRDAPDRQRTLRNTIAWSYNLLDDAEKRLLARMAIFSGGCSLDAIEVVCGDGSESDTFEILVSLVDKSLVQQKETVDGQPRFMLLETIRDFAQEQLVALGEGENIRRRYADYYVTFAERAEPEMRMAQQKRWFQMLETERENLRTMLEGSVHGGDITDGIRMAGVLSWYWYVSGHHAEGLEWCRQLLPLLDHAPEPHHAKFLIGTAHMMRVRNLTTHIPLLKRALATAQRLGDKQHTAYALIRLGYEMMESPNALPTVEEGVSLFRALDYSAGVAHGLTIIGEIHRFRGNIEEARHCYEETLSLCRRMGDTRGSLISLLNLTFVARHQNNDAQAVVLAREALRFACDLELRAEMVECLAALAGMIGATGQPEVAASLFGTVERTLERLGAFYDEPDRQEFDGMVATVRSALDSEKFERAWAEGRQISLEQAIASVLEMAHDDVL